MFHKPATSHFVLYKERTQDKIKEGLLIEEYPYHLILLIFFCEPDIHLVRVLTGAFHSSFSSPGL